MNRVLYYPYFEMENELYMKIALLYFQELKTIVPQRYVSQLSDKHKLITNYTNLLSTYNPRWNDSQVATRKTINKLEELSRNNRYFQTQIKNWQKHELFSIEIFSEKYSKDFVDYLSQYNFCVKSENGILVHKDIASLFMTYFAFQVRDANQMNIISDEKINNRLFINFEDPIRHNCDSKEFMGVTKMLEVVIPKNIVEIPLEKIIELRNSEGYLSNLKAFHSLVEKYNSNYELDQFRLLNIIREIEESKKEIGLGRILTSSAGVLTFILSSVYAIKNPGIGLEEMTALASLGAFVGNEIKEYYSNQSDPNIISAKSYLTAIKEL